MLFNSFDFGLFLSIAFLIYWGIGGSRRFLQNVFLLVASYFFYAVWDWRFLLLLLSSSLIDYMAGLYLERAENSFQRKLALYSSVIWNLGVLIAFKYFNFFLDSFYMIFRIAPDSPYTFWNIAIPVGLSFYTFQTMGYTIDVYRGKIPASRNPITFLCFVSFFPQLVAGPIERAKKLIPQFEKNRVFNSIQATDGMRQILWGLFKKIIVAEKLGLAVDMAFENPENYHFLTLTYAAVLFCFQVYCDFSGYTDIAIGTGKLLGFRLSENFRLPYLAKSFTDFWQRWHITLTNWFTDYVYVPFVKSFQKITVGTRIAGLFLTMTLVGLWHGAKWTFISFGILNALFLMAERIPFNRKKLTLSKALRLTPKWVSALYVFMGFILSAIMFRAASMEQAFLYLKRIISFSSDGMLNSLIGWKAGYLLVLLLMELIFKKGEFPLHALEKMLPRPLRWVVYYIIIFIVIRYAEPKEAFIYFQF